MRQFATAFVFVSLAPALMPRPCDGQESTGGRAAKAPADEQVLKLVRAHESTLGLLHQFDIQLEIWNGQPDQEPSRNGTWRWARKGAVERIRHADSLRDPAKGTVVKTLFGDQFDEGENRHVLKGWDPNRPVELTPTAQRGVSAFLGRQTSLQMAVPDPAPLLLLAFRDVTETPGTRLPLRELVQRAKAVEVRPTAAKGADADGSLVCLRIWRTISKENQGSKSGRYFDVFLDPNAGMLARKLVNHQDQYAWPDGTTLPWAEWVHEVKKFHSAGDGVFFPIESETKVFRSDRAKPTAIDQIKSSSYTVNRDLPADAIDFKFPENAMVVSEEGGKRTVQLWGPDNKPLHTMRTREEVQQVIQNLEAAKKDTPSRPWLIWALVASCAALTVVVVLRVWVRRRRSAHA